MPKLYKSPKTRAERRNCTELTWLSFWPTDQRTSKASPLVIGGRVLARIHRRR